MELVILAHIILHRPGSASSHHGFGPMKREYYWVGEVKDDSLDTLRQKVISIAESQGESKESLEGLQQDVRQVHRQPSFKNEVCFNVYSVHVSYGSPYATCDVHPALKIGDRYFRLEEVSVSAKG